MDEAFGCETALLGDCGATAQVDKYRPSGLSGGQDLRIPIPIPKGVQKSLDIPLADKYFSRNMASATVVGVVAAIFAGLAKR